MNSVNNKILIKIIAIVSSLCAIFTMFFDWVTVDAWLAKESFNLFSVVKILEEVEGFLDLGVSAKLVGLLCTVIAIIILLINLINALMAFFERETPKVYKICAIIIPCVTVVGVRILISKSIDIDEVDEMLKFTMNPYLMVIFSIVSTLCTGGFRQIVTPAVEEKVKTVIDAGKDMVKEAISNNIQCSNCGKMLTVNDKFCTHCGEKVINTKLCPNCGSKINPNGKFCIHCGERIINTKLCPNCGSEMNINSKFCAKCGENVAQAKDTYTGRKDLEDSEGNFAARSNQKNIGENKTGNNGFSQAGDL